MVWKSREGIRAAAIIRREHMEFVLRYKGAPPAGRRGNETKHRIRQVFHEQLVDLCRSEPRFSDALKPDLPEGVAVSSGSMAVVMLMMRDTGENLRSAKRRSPR